MPSFYIRWDLPCSCSFEEEVDEVTQDKTLLFTHNICSFHNTVAKNSNKKSKLTKQDIIAKKEDMWSRNRNNNMNQYENHKEVQKIKNKIKDKQKATMTPDELFLESVYIENRENVIREINDWERKNRLNMLLGLESEFALSGEDVYNHIKNNMSEQNQFLSGT